ncbi:MAG TPA: hypothetical protein DCS45_13535, partial [Roseovarius nubinhibens]|nr:hypothetical protein [Roseovarius nubinhibens]
MQHDPGAVQSFGHGARALAGGICKSGRAPYAQVIIDRIQDFPMTAFLAAAAAALSLSFPTAPASPAAPEVQVSGEGYYASGWPIALAEAACDGDELCLTKLANCGPRNGHCSAGIALCQIKRGQTLRLSRPCPIDRVAGRAGRVILMTLPSGRVRTLLFQSNGFAAIDGNPA